MTLRRTLVVFHLTALCSLQFSLGATTPIEETTPVAGETPTRILVDRRGEPPPLCGGQGPVGFAEMLLDAAERYRVDPAMLLAVVLRESGCVPTAVGSAGEIGLAQVHPRVWGHRLERVGILTTPEDLFNPEVNLHAAAYILADISRRTGGDARATLRRYNGSGPQAHRYASEVYAIYLTHQDRFQ